MYAEALADVLSYAAGSAAGEAISRLVGGSSSSDASAGAVERAEAEDERKGRIGFIVASTVGLVFALSLFRNRRR